MAFGTYSVVTPPAPVGGLPPTNYNTALGGTPQLPNPTDVTANTNLTNLAQGPQTQQLVTQTAQSNAAGAAAPYNANLPNYQELIGKQSSNILDELHGVLPPDVLALLQEQGGERGVATGVGDSPNGNASYLQALGLTSLGQEAQGVRDLNTAIGETPTGPAVNTQTYQTPIETELNQLNNQSLYNSAPIPSYAARANANASAAGRAAGAGAVTQPVAPSVPGMPGSPATAPSYVGQQTPSYGYPPIGEVDGQTVAKLIALGYNQEDIQNMSAAEADATTGGNNFDWNPSTPSYTPPVSYQPTQDNIDWSNYEGEWA